MGLPLLKPHPLERRKNALVHIKTYGCSHNISDSEYMAGQLGAQGYLITDDETQAEVIIINSCTVKGPSQESFFSSLSLAKSRGQKVIVAGCVPQADRGNARLAGANVVGVQRIDGIADAVARVLEGERVSMLEKNSMPSLALPKSRKNPLVEIIPINLGCLGACTYCKTKHARGSLRSYSVEEIVGRVKQSVDEGVVQIWLTSEDCGAYGRDIGASLPELLRAILDILPASVMLRIGMTNPPYILEHLDAMIALLNHHQVFSFLHVPVQSGSDAVLSAMKREYTVAEFQEVVDRLRGSVPGVTVATDIICGFPNETQVDFDMTLELVERNIFPVLNISQFYPRPDTLAARMPLLPTQEVKRRSTLLTRLFKAQRPYDALVGTTRRVWFITTSDDGRYTVGHTKPYGLVLVERNDALLGQSREVTVLRAGKHFVEAKVAGQ